MGQGLDKVHNGLKAAKSNDSNGVNQMKEGEDLMVQSSIEFNQICNAIRIEAASKGIKFD